MKKLTSHVSFLHHRLVGKYDEESDQLNALFSEYLQSEQQGGIVPQVETGGETGETASGTAIAGGGGGDEMTEDELRELEVLKYKYENGAELIRKEYEQQLEFITNKVRSFSLFLR
jgi:hypothetical protein